MGAVCLLTDGSLWIPEATRNSVPDPDGVENVFFMLSNGLKWEFVRRGEPAPPHLVNNASPCVDSQWD